MRHPGAVRFRHALRPPTHSLLFTFALHLVPDEKVSVRTYTVFARGVLRKSYPG